MFEIAGHLGVWPGFYAASALCCFLQLAGLWRSAGETFRMDVAMLAVGLTTVGTYLLDRVKLRSSLIDPADCAAQVDRYRFLVAHQRLARTVVLLCLIGGAVAGFEVSRWAPLTVFAGLAAVVFYAPGPHTEHWTRPKDLFLIKNAYTAIGLAGFIAIAGAASVARADRIAAWWRVMDRAPAVLAAAVIFIRVLLDAALSDIDDAATDRVFGTRTAATRFGQAGVQRVAIIGHAALAMAVVACPYFPTTARVAWSAVAFASTLMMRRARTGFVRELVDVRFGIEAILATVIVTLLT